MVRGYVLFTLGGPDVFRAVEQHPTRGLLRRALARAVPLHGQVLGIVLDRTDAEEMPSTAA